MVTILHYYRNLIGWLKSSQFSTYVKHHCGRYVDNMPAKEDL